MALLKASLALLALSAKLVAAQYTLEDQEEQHRNARCVNGCLFDAWPEGYCVDDPACTCNNQDKREAYLCCVAEKCVVGEWEESWERASDNCDAFGIPFTFDVKGACGFTPESASTSSVEVVESKTETSTVTKTESKTESAMGTATETATEATTEISDAEETESGTESASATASPTESQTGEESAETSSPPDSGAFVRGVSWSGMAVVAAGAGLLL